MNSTVRSGRFVVHVAENGHSFECDCDENNLVHDVQRFLESVSGTNVNDQLLLCLNMKLESRKPLSIYKLPSDDREVFLYNKSRMRINSQPPSPESIEIVEIPNPTPPSSSSYPLEDNPDPALRAIPSYDIIFRYNYQLGHAIYNRIVTKLKKCEKLLGEQKVQERAMEIARDNLDHLYGTIHQNYTDFMKCYCRQDRKHSNLMMNFGKNIEKLRYCRLHPALQTTDRNCLFDLVKEDNLQLQKIVANEYRDSYKQFEKKISEFEQDFDELKMIVEELFSSKASSIIIDSERAINDHYGYIHEHKSIMKSISKDVKIVKKIIDDCLSNQSPSSIRRPYDAVSSLGPIYDIQDQNYLPKLENCDSTISKLLNFCKEKKNDMNIFIYNYMQKIAYVQYAMKNIRCRFSVFIEAMKHQNDQFHFLRIIHGIGPSYRACFAEIVRRKCSFKLHMGNAGLLAEKLDTNREIEVRKRKKFLRWHSLYIPQDVLAMMGLFDNPNLCQVDIAPYDCNLLDIDISDLDGLAPEYLVGNWKGSFNEINETICSETSNIEVENVKLKADLASAIARICTLNIEMLGDSKIGSAMKEAAEKNSEALRLKDEYGKKLGSLLKDKQMECDSYEKKIIELEQRLYEVSSNKVVLCLSNEMSGNNIALAEIKEVNRSQKLLEDSYTNCAHLENRVKKRTLFEIFRMVISSGEIDEFPESLRVLSNSLANSIGDDDELGECIKLLADKVGLLSNYHNEELIEKYAKVKEQLEKELDENKELASTLHRKHQLEKQANNEKISFGHLKVQEIAAFVLNSPTGHYEAINNCRCCNYYLSDESVSLLTNHLQNRPSYLIGQIVHIEQQTVKTVLSSNPYDLPVGCEYFIITVEMLPDISDDDDRSSTPTS
ncbi:autophagy-related protein 11-like [Impatiens glandulifera]|uniref:autophagy-related protein 11-like n=1 Tax=Impatiens glandulifera TaxID=253017 RepID=UPI001FB0848E|nr:autophagy-related protein 11-like [Impatiens glandulifera]